MAPRRRRSRRSGSSMQRRSAAARAGTSPGRDEQTGRYRNRVGHRTTRGGHDRQPTRQGLGQRHAVALVEGRRDEQVGGGVGSGEVGLAELAWQPDPVAYPSGCDSGSQPPRGHSVALQAAADHKLPCPGHLGQRLHQQLLAFAGRHRADAQHAADPVGGARGKRGGVGAGCRHRDLRAGHAQKGHEEGGRAPAGDDGAAYCRQGSPFALLQGCSLRLSEACLKAQRVVDQSHEVEARRRLGGQRRHGSEG